MTATAEKEQFTFQAEIKQLLNLLANSLYQSRDITLRELVSNASDALDKMRHISLVDEAHKDPGPLEIRLETDDKTHELRVSDTGVGMTHDELVNNLGTIAKSGSLEFLKNLSGDAKSDLSLIGQFGVGFYSAFMLADKVQVNTRHFSEENGWQWESDGSGTFSITPLENLPRGTQIVLHLKEDCREFAEEQRVRHVIRTYSSFIQHPIKMGQEVLNEQKPIWVEPAAQLKDEDYERFYQHLSHHPDEKPLWRLHVSLDAPIQFHALLYCPPHNIEPLGFMRYDHGLTLCAKRVMVQNDCRELLPEYLRFMHGLVDSEDLPLNVSREALQDNTVFRKIQTALVGQTLAHLEKLAADDGETYARFYREFGGILKEGLPTDFSRRERLAGLLRYASSEGKSPETLVSLEEYVGRSSEDQKQIYYCCGPDAASINKNPNLEVFRQRSLEVLYFTEPIDEFVANALGEFNEKKFASIDAEELELPDEKKDEQEKPADDDKGKAASGAQAARLISLFRAALGEEVAEVRESKRLTDSPCCLVNPTGGMSPQMERIMKMHHGELPPTKRIFEINPASPLIAQLARLTANEGHDEFIRNCGRLLFANALLLAGMAPDVQTMVGGVNNLMEEVAAGKSPIIH